MIKCERCGTWSDKEWGVAIPLHWDERYPHTMDTISPESPGGIRGLCQACSRELSLDREKVEGYINQKYINQKEECK